MPRVKKIIEGIEPIAIDDMAENIIIENAAAEKKSPRKKTVEKPSDKENVRVKKVSAKTNVKTKKILFVSSEAAPFITTGGLGEVIGALPKALAAADENIDARVVIPFYDELIKKSKLDTSLDIKFLDKIYVDLGWRHQYCGIYTAKVDKVTYYFIDNEYYFKRADCYGHFDDGERFAFFGKAVLEMLTLIEFIPDVIHTHDWQSALVSIYLRMVYSWREEYQKIKTIFTIHNIEYQGKYSLSILYDVFDIPYEYKHVVEYDGCINLMKGAIMSSDLVTTVSPTYSKEIHDSYFSHGLAPIISYQTHKIRGILNGIDTDSYNPETDSRLFVNYNADSVQLKKQNKIQLQTIFNLKTDETIPVIAIITRLVRHKGIDLIVGAMNELSKLPVQVIVLGKGDHDYELLFESYMERYPDKFSVKIGFNNESARRIYAGADMFLMPSKFEPCGLSQMIAARYGTIPLVRETGGLKDSIVPYTDDSGNGFTFYDYISDNIVDIIKRALNVYNDEKKWNELVLRAMKWDFSWNVSALEYLKMYNEIL